MNPKERIILEHLPLVKTIAGRLRENLLPDVDLDDLVQAGVLGLIDAASKFKPEKEVQFPTYARHRIKGAILDSLRLLDRASRDLRRRQKAIAAASHDLSVILQRTPTESEIADKLGINMERWHRIKLDLKTVGLMAASERTQEHDELPAPDFPCSPSSHPDSLCLQHELSVAIEDALHVLLPRLQEVIRLYYEGGITMKEIGLKLGVNESRVSQMHTIALHKMREAMLSAGIDSVKAFETAGVTIRENARLKETWLPGRTRPRSPTPPLGTDYDPGYGFSGALSSLLSQGRLRLVRNMCCTSGFRESDRCRRAQRTTGST